MTTRYQCKHITDGHHPATVTCEMRAIPGAPTRAQLDTVTELCTLCAARMVAALTMLERDGGELVFADTEGAP